MRVLEGHENLQARDVMGFTPDGKVMIREGEGSKLYNMKMLPGGELVGRPLAPPPIDQLGERVKTPLAQRHIGVDQHA